eukprot:2689891-Pleurochrysis_carterae.AAC.2
MKVKQNGTGYSQEHDKALNRRCGGQNITLHTFDYIIIYEPARQQAVLFYFFPSRWPATKLPQEQTYINRAKRKPHAQHM